MQPAQTVLSYAVQQGTSYIDIAEGLSKVNRRAYKQGMEYAIGKIIFGYQANPQVLMNVALTAFTAGNTWVVHNAWKKAFGHWTAQQRRARRLIGQSAKPTWEDFKVYLDDSHRLGTIVQTVAGDGAAVGPGEWEYAALVWEADDNSIDECRLHLIGGDVSTTDKGLILAYQQSRATVQPEDPDLPDEYNTNLYALMAADQDAVADEVADNMEYRNDEPPYDHDDYPGNDTNSDSAWLQQFAVASTAVPVATLPGFVAQCGLLRLDLQGHSAADGSDANAVETLVQVHLVPGSYKGVMAAPMGQ